MNMDGMLLLARQIAMCLLYTHFYIRGPERQHGQDVYCSSCFKCTLIRRVIGVSAWALLLYMAPMFTIASAAAMVYFHIGVFGDLRERIER